MSDEKPRHGLTADQNRTLAELLFRCPEAQRREDLERFRIAYEAEHGETDLTKRYTSVWPPEDQKWLWENHPKRFYDGLPPFLQAYFTRGVDERAQSGQLDDLPAQFIEMYIKNQLRRDGPGSSR